MNQDLFREMLKEKGLKVTSQRLLVLEIMVEHLGEHLTAEQTFDLVRVQYPEISLATIRRTVQVLVDLRLIDKVGFDDGFAHYELGEFDGEQRHHHHHTICRQCGQVISFEDDLLEALERAVYDKMGFMVVDHEMKSCGYCKECRKKFEEEERQSWRFKIELKSRVKKEQNQDMEVADWSNKVKNEIQRRG